MADNKQKIILIISANQLQKIKELFEEQGWEWHPQMEDFPYTHLRVDVEPAIQDIPEIPAMPQVEGDHHCVCRPYITAQRWLQSWWAQEKAPPP